MSFNRACAGALGGLLGSLIAGQLGAFWILGAFAGGIIGWISTDVPGFFRGVARAFSETAREIFSRRPDWAWWGYMLSAATYGASFFWSYLAILVVGRYVLMTPTDLMKVCLGLWMLVAFMYLLKGVDDSVDEVKEWRNGTRQVFFAINSLTLPFTCLFYMFVLMRFILGSLPVIRRFLRKFTMRTFAYTHTDVRRVCFLNAYAGVVAGHYAHQNLLVSTLVGGTLGALYYPLTKNVAERMSAKMMRGRKIRTAILASQLTEEKAH